MYFGFVDVILFHSGHQHVSVTLGAIFSVVRTRDVIVCTMNCTLSSLTNLDHSSPHVSSMYITPHTAHKNI